MLNSRERVCLVRHFGQVPESVIDELFWLPPAEFELDTDRHLLAQALGATLYVPGTRPNLVETIRKRAAEGVRSVVIDLEDAIADAEVEHGIDQVAQALLDFGRDPLPCLVFVRIREVEQIRRIADRLSDSSLEPLQQLAGFVLPKFSAATGARFLGEIAAASETAGRRLFAMPVIETPDVLYRETRDEALSAIRDLLAQYREYVLAVRLGATDLCGLYGIRRGRDLTIYDVGIVAELISEVVNHLGRADGTGYAITGPVWEYFDSGERLFRPQLRSSPFEHRHATSLRHRLVQGDFDGLVREIVLDRANGLSGKTVIHPTHVGVVHALSIVLHEEYADAQDILASAGGAKASGYRNKMNETRPHRRWAQRIVDRANVFGVLRPEQTHIDALAALLQKTPVTA